jgi:hypothetical protein
MFHIDPHNEPEGDHLDLFFAGQRTAGVMSYAWSLMYGPNLWAAEWDVVESWQEHSADWTAIAAFGLGCKFLHSREWKGKLTVKTHRPSEVLKVQTTDRLVLKARAFLDGIRWTAQQVPYEQNMHCDELCRMAYAAWIKGNK